MSVLPFNKRVQLLNSREHLDVLFFHMYLGLSCYAGPLAASHVIPLYGTSIIDLLVI